MNIEKNGKIYNVRENVHVWTLTATIGGLSVTYSVQKTECPTFDALKAYVATCDAIL